MFSIFNNKKRRFNRNLTNAVKAIQILSMNPFLTSLDSQKRAKNELSIIKAWWEENVDLYKNETTISEEDFELIRKILQLPNSGKFKNLNGKKITYYSNGQVEDEWNYVNGYKDGIQLGWYENGQLSYEHNYQKDYMDGIQRRWFENGNLESENNYKFTRENLNLLSSSVGWQRKFHENGNLKEESYHDEESYKHVLTKWYSESGVLKELREFKNSEIHCCEYDESGILINEWVSKR